MAATWRWAGTSSSRSPVPLVLPRGNQIGNSASSARLFSSTITAIPFTAVPLLRASAHSGGRTSWPGPISPATRSTGISAAPNWRFCGKCGGLFWNGDDETGPTNGACPGGGKHVIPQGSYDFVIPVTPGSTVAI